MWSTSTLCAWGARAQSQHLRHCQAMSAEVRHIGMCAASRELPEMCGTQTQHAYVSDTTADWTAHLSVKLIGRTWTEKRESRAPGRMPCMPHA